MVQTSVSNEQHKRLHPHKFTLWVAMASMIMMFAGLTSAFIVKSSLTGWRTIELPKVFWVSTAFILVSSITIQMAVKAFKGREMQRYRTLMGVTFVLGIAFVVCQIMGFSELWNQNVRFKGSSGAGQFFYAIAGLHALHVIGGMVALLVMVVKSLAGKIKLYSAVPVEVMSIYWHFVDLLWLYLLIFFIIVG
ncbi:MAG: heme-copper oxidase subunit III [Niabella sp.]